MGLFDRLKQGPAKTRNSISDALDALIGDYSQVDDDFFDELEEILVCADMGTGPAEKILSDMKARLHEERLKDAGTVRRLLIESVAAQMRPAEDRYDFEKEKSVIMVIGVNGVGKTTTIGKLGMLMKNAGRKVVFCAADTFRAAADEQLKIWSERTGILMISGKEQSDPASVLYDSIAAFKKNDADVLICDTAGRLHNKKNLMAELSKMDRIIQRELPDVRKEVFMVLDATTGQNALSQAREFVSSCHVTGLILTKMDGTARGGIAVAVSSEFNIPVLYIGVGETAEDLQRFDPEAYSSALFGKNDR